MRRIFQLVVFFVILPLGFQSHAQDGNNAVSRDEWCNVISTLSESVMLARQNGVPMSRLMQILGKKETSERLRSTYRDMAIDAYERPMFSTEENKNRSIVEFQNKWYLNCLK